MLYYLINISGRLHVYLGGINSGALRHSYISHSNISSESSCSYPHHCRISSSEEVFLSSEAVLVPSVLWFSPTQSTWPNFRQLPWIQRNSEWGTPIPCARKSNRYTSYRSCFVLSLPMCTKFRGKLVVSMKKVLLLSQTTCPACWVKSPYGNLPFVAILCCYNVMLQTEHLRLASRPYISILLALL